MPPPHVSATSAGCRRGISRARRMRQGPRGPLCTGGPSVGLPPAPQHPPGCGQRCPRAGPCAVHGLGSALAARYPRSPVHCSPRRRGAGGVGPCALPFLRGAAWGLPLCCGTAARRPEESVTLRSDPLLQPPVPRQKLSCARVPALPTPLVSAVGVSPCGRTDLGRAGVGWGPRGCAPAPRAGLALCNHHPTPVGEGLCGRGAPSAHRASRPPFPPHGFSLCIAPRPPPKCRGRV